MKKSEPKVTIPNEAWHVIEEVLAVGVPNPHDTVAALICKEERRRIKHLLERKIAPMNYRMKE